MSKTSDEVRKAILVFLHQVHEKARSRRSTRAPISELKREIKKSGFKEHQIVSELDYLIQAGWIKVDAEKSEFTTPRGFVKRQTKEYYRISDSGINYFEGPSEFQKVEKSISGVNITNIQGITVVGDQNIVVNTQYRELFNRLSLLSEVVRKSDQFSDETKLNYAKDIDTIKDQLSKSLPNKSVIKLVWEKLQPLATVVGIATFFKQVAELIGSVIA
jgi:DNA-binding PadR family transcriptional regulator